jgi:hypothetical protein
MRNIALPIALVALLAACGSDGSDDGDGPGGADDDRGGPDSLVGHEWTSDPVTVNGIEFVFGFQFDEGSVTASNTCNGEVTATAEAPVRYRYTATIPVAGRTDEEEGGDTCFAEIAAGTFEFEIVDGKLVLTFDGETIEFEPAGDTAGLYGEWTAEAPGVGTLIWSMGGGAISATSECDNGLSATVEVDAEFVNKLEITEAAEDVVMDRGLECSVGIAAGTSTYRFDGDVLILVTGGEEIRFHRR